MQRHRGNGSFHNGRHHYELRSCFRPHYRRQRHLSCSIGHGKHASHLSRFRWSRGICKTTSSTTYFFIPFFSTFLSYQHSSLFMIPSQGVETVDSSHFITKENIERLKQAKEANRVQVLQFAYFCVYGEIIT